MGDRIVENVKIGDEIKAGVDEDGNTIKYVVTNVYKHCVLACYMNFRRCFSYGDLVQRGLEPCYGDIYTKNIIQRTDYDLGDADD